MVSQKPMRMPPENAVGEEHCAQNGEFKFHGSLGRANCSAGYSIGQVAGFEQMLVAG
jgi:hypothetical protein